MVMEGSVRYANGRVLITAQLIDGRSGGHLWSDEFNRDLTDVFAVQAEVAQRIATAMQVQLLPEEQVRIQHRATESMEAYQHYLHALSLPDPRIFPEYAPVIIELLKRAIAADPNFAEAYAALAMFSSDQNVTLDYANKAIELDPTLGGAHATLGNTYGNYYARQEEARAANLRAIEFSPNDLYRINAARHLAEQSGDYTEAIQLGRRAIEIAPYDAFFHSELGRIYLGAGDLAAATRSMREAMRLDPDNYEHYLNLATVVYLDGNRGAAKKNLDRAVEIMSSGATYRADYIAYLYGLLGEPDQATKLLARLEQVYNDRQREIWPPLVWAALGTQDKERALHECTMLVHGYIEEDRPVSLARIAQFRDNWLNDPMLEESEFIELRRRLGFKG
jgi:adenylate cyclase